MGQDDANYSKPVSAAADEVIIRDASRLERVSRSGHESQVLAACPGVPESRVDETMNDYQAAPTLVATRGAAG